MQKGGRGSHQNNHFETLRSNDKSSPPTLSKSGYLGALTYISGLVVLTADRTLAVGPSEDQTHKLPFNQFIQNLDKN